MQRFPLLNAYGMQNIADFVNNQEHISPPPLLYKTIARNSVVIGFANTLTIMPIPNDEVIIADETFYELTASTQNLPPRYRKLTYSPMQAQGVLCTYNTQNNDLHLYFFTPLKPVPKRKTQTHLETMLTPAYQ